MYISTIITIKSPFYLHFYSTACS